MPKKKGRAGKEFMLTPKHDSRLTNHILVAWLSANSFELDVEECCKHLHISKERSVNHLSLRLAWRVC